MMTFEVELIVGSGRIMKILYPVRHGKCAGEVKVCPKMILDKKNNFVSDREWPLMENIRVKSSLGEGLTTRKSVYTSFMYV